MLLALVNQRISSTSIHPQLLLLHHASFFSVMEGRVLSLIPFFSARFSGSLFSSLCPKPTKSPVCIIPIFNVNTFIGP